MKTSSALTMVGALSLALCLPGPSRADEPLSAIDWLSKSVTAPSGAATAAGQNVSPRVNEPPVAAGGALPVDVATTALDGPSPDAAGLISAEVSGLPRDLWGAGLSDEIARAVTRDRMSSLPALRQLFLTMLLAEASPPIDSGGRGVLLLARVDKLMQIGALEQAAALLDLAGDPTAESFRRVFDVALLTGNEDRACKRMREAPGLAPTIPARVFCLARAGDWDAAALTLSTAKVLDQLSGTDADLLARFLEPELAENELMPPPPSPVTPLYWKMYEAVGETLSTASLPAAFAYAELGPQAGWMAQIEAAERLTRAGTIAPNVILGLYTERSPAASGGIWDRIDAFQSFEAAFSADDAARISETLPPIWTKMQEAELEVPFAYLYGKLLAERSEAGGLSQEASAIAFRVGLLSPGYDDVARARHARDSYEEFLIGLALGDLKGLIAPDTMGRAIAPAFLRPNPSGATQDLLDGKRYGEALLQAIEEIALGVEGNLTSVTQGLSLLRLAGLEDVARRTALQLMILERRG